jgi:hypothetical protein
LDLLEAQALNAAAADSTPRPDKTAQHQNDAPEDDFDELTEAELAEIEKRAVGGEF